MAEQQQQVDTPVVAPSTDGTDTTQSVPPADTPTGDDNPPASQGGENELERERARAATALKEKADLEKENKRLARELKLANRDNTQPPQGPDDGQDPAPVAPQDNAVELANAALAVTNAVAFNPEYQAVLNEDPTLREVFQRNPLFYVKDFIDVEDAVEQVKEVLDARVAAKQNAAPATPETPPAPQADTPPATPDAPQDPAQPVIPQKGMTITPDMAAAIPYQEYAKLSDDVRTRLRNGETVTI